MSYKFGQFRRGQLDEYLIDKKNEISLITNIVKSPISTDVKFREKEMTGCNLISTTNGIDRKYYYLKFKIDKRSDGKQTIVVRLNNNEIDSENPIDDENKIQTLQSFEIGEGVDKDYVIFDMVIAPNASYNRIQFLLQRNLNDYQIENEDETYGRELEIEILTFSEIQNVVDILKVSALEGKEELKQIGIQGAPGLQMCIDGESIRVGKSGIFEIKNGVIVKFVGFIIEPNDKQYFLMDYQY